MLLAPEGEKGRGVGQKGTRRWRAGKQGSASEGWLPFLQLLFFFNVKTLGVRVKFLMQKLDLPFILQMALSKIFKTI